MELIEVMEAHGNINCFIICNEGVLVGIDSRKTMLRLRNHLTNVDPSTLIAMKNEEKYFQYLVSDVDQKYKELTLKNETIIGLTGCGNLERRNEIWKYCEKLVSLDSIDALAEKASGNLKETYKGKDCELYIAGYSVPKQAYVVHHIGDGINDKIYSSLDIDSNQHGAIGSGSSHALPLLKKYVKPRMSYENAFKAINIALVAACCYDISCGGHLKVNLITKDEDGLARSRKNDCFNLMLNGYFSFKENMLLFFTHEENEHMNYYILHECLKRRDEEYPVTLGRLNCGWNLFMAVFKDGRVAREVYEEGKSKEGCKDGFRYIIYHDEAGTKHELFMLMANPETLRDVQDIGPCNVYSFSWDRCIL